MRIISSIVGCLIVSACVGPEGPAGPAGMNGGEGSSSTTQTPDLFESGTRIKARTTVTEYSTADGAARTLTSFGGWFDTERNEPCSPAVASDAKTRCLPSAVTAPAASGYFADAACTVPAVVGFSCAAYPAPKYIAVAPPTMGGCQPSTAGAKLFLVGAPVPSYYSKSGATCSGPTSIGADFVFYPVSGAEIPPTTFAEMTVTATTTP